MTSKYAPTDADDTTRHPERAGDGDDAGDTRRLSPEADEAEDEEAGYGYGV